MHKEIFKNFSLQILNGRIQFLLDHLKNVTYALSCYESLTKSLTLTRSHSVSNRVTVLIRGVFFFIAHILFYQSNYFFRNCGHRPEILLLGGSPHHFKFYNRHKSLNAKHGHLDHSRGISLCALGSCG